MLICVPLLEIGEVDVDFRRDLQEDLLVARPIGLSQTLHLKLHVFAFVFLTVACVLAFLSSLIINFKIFFS